MTVIEVVLKELRERKEQLTDGLAHNSAKDYPDYRFICGEIRGLAAVEIYLTDLAKNLEHFDD